MAANKRTAGEREADLETIAREFLAGKSQAEIGKQLNLSQQQVSHDIKKLDGRWQAGVGEWNTHKARELARINDLEAEYHRAWQRSCEDKEVNIAEKSTAAGDGGERSKTAKRREGQSGNPAFLAGVLACIQARIDLLRPVAEKGPNAGLVVTVNNNSLTLAGMTMEEFRALPTEEKARLLQG